MGHNNAVTLTPVLNAADGQLQPRTAAYAALGDPIRLAIADALLLTDLTPQDIVASLGVRSNLLAHHLNVLQDAGLVHRVRSRGDGRRRYVHLAAPAMTLGLQVPKVAANRVLFVDSGNAGRAHLAATIWASRCEVPVHVQAVPLSDVSRGAATAAARNGYGTLLDPPPVNGRPPDVVVTLCDLARESGFPAPGATPAASLHWSMAEPTSPDTYDEVITRLERRMGCLCTATGACDGINA